ncbi:MAG: hypothetical protein DSZ28_05705 [Thiothrix sp.]|nr:MAG: hypothetical protein DSZ28_05705 [Thiothrix sp.]
MNTLKIMLSLLFASSLMACGGGSGSNSGDETLELGDGGSSSLITGINGKSIAIDTIELLGVLLELKDDLNVSIEAPVGGGCSGGGKKTVNSGSAGSFDINYEACTDSIGGLTFTINGPLSVVIQGDSKKLSGGPLAVHDGQGTWTLSDIKLDLKTVENVNRLSVDLSMEGRSRFNLKAKAVSTEPFTGPNLVCPDSGKLTLTATDGSTVSINGVPGVNLLLDIHKKDQIDDQAEHQTLGCSEIAINQEPLGSGGLAPPGAP